MPSITYWNRLEPRPRSRSIVQALAAQVRDPLWLLARQWQLGEFQGEDAGTPAWTRVERSVSRLFAWRTPGGALRRLDGTAPLEPLALREPRALDLSMRVELGQVFEDLLTNRGAAALAGSFRTAYPLAAVAPGGDAEAARFLTLCAGRSFDGGALLLAARASAPSLPAQPVLSGADADAVAARAALDDLSAWADQVFGPLGDAAPDPWQPERLAYRLDAETDTPSGERATLAVHPAATGDLEWFSFDLTAPPAPGGTAPTSLPPLSLLPTPVRFRGMPVSGFWDFERSSTDLGEVTPELSEVAKLVFLDFLFVHGSDWYVLPLQQQVGTLCSIDRLTVRDVFGRETLITRAGARDTGAERWSLFSLSGPSGTAARADFLLVPPTAAGALQQGPALEEVRFLRDELASMAWAIEEQTQNALGAPRPGAERSTSSTAPIESDGSGRGNSLRYRIQTQVPGHWLPLVPISLDPLRGEVALELAESSPEGRLLRTATSPYRLREEEIPREGTRILRIPFRCRWTDGTTHTWTTRIRRVGAGQGSSGLRFDVVVPPSATPAGGG